MVCGRNFGTVFGVTALGDLNANSFALGSGESIPVWGGDGTLVRVVEVGKMVFSLSLSPCGLFVAAGCENGFVNLYQLPDWDQAWSVRAHSATVWSVSLGPAGRFLASCGNDGTVKILSVDTGATLRTLTGHEGGVNSVLFSQDGTKVFSGGGDKTVRRWRIFWAMERRTRALFAGLVVDERTDIDRDVLLEVVWRMKRLWEVEAE
jgi:WD40 repeat protein